MVLLLNCHADLTHIALRTVVQPTIMEDELHIIHKVLNFLVLVLLELGFDSVEVHWVLHDEGVVRDLELHVVDWLTEDVGLLVAQEGGEQALGGFFPLVENGGALGHLGHLQAA